nr:MAG TPA: hypothetical protein [Caudoviricetes sp.]
MQKWYEKPPVSRLLTMKITFSIAVSYCHVHTIGRR